VLFRSPVTHDRPCERAAVRMPHTLSLHVSTWEMPVNVPDKRVEVTP
jgi:hypothetical protein